MKLTAENRSTLGKTSATLSITNPTWTDTGSNPGLCGERPATNRLSHGTASTLGFTMSSIFLSYVVILQKSVEGFSVSVRRGPGSTGFRRPEAMAPVSPSLLPISPGLTAEGQKLAHRTFQIHLFLNFSGFLLFIALTTFHQLPDQTRPAVKSNGRMIM
jgi:hypothetical protein